MMLGLQMVIFLSSCSGQPRWMFPQQSISWIFFIKFEFLTLRTASCCQASIVYWRHGSSGSNPYGKCKSMQFSLDLLQRSELGNFFKKRYIYFNLAFKLWNEYPKVLPTNTTAWLYRSKNHKESLNLMNCITDHETFFVVICFRNKSIFNKCRGDQGQL